jgi:DNA-binding response OmpR family regulator
MRAASPAIPTAQNSQVLIVDPHVDTEMLYRAWWRDRGTRSAPILLVDARDNEPDRARAAGADAVLVKPVSPDVLLEAIRRLLAPSTDGAQGGAR